jgi:hypothetical protein
LAKIAENSDHSIDPGHWLKTATEHFALPSSLERMDFLQQSTKPTSDVSYSLQGFRGWSKTLSATNGKVGQGDQIGRIFAHRALVCFRRFYLNLRSISHIWDTFSTVLNLAKNGLGRILGDFFAN